ncbi:sugar-binding transcriptional regulator, partial [Salinispira pacifica]
MDAENRRLLYKVAKAYYEDELTQKEIGDRFGLSRVKVNRLLARAREERIVQIQVVLPEPSQSDLERRLEESCGLAEAVVVPFSRSHDGLLRNLGEGAAGYLRRVIGGGESVGITWGTALYAMAEAMTPTAAPAARVVQLLGGLGDPDADVHGAEIARRLSILTSARPRVLAAPGVVATPSVRRALLADPQVADTLDLASRVDIAVVGIGTLDSRSVVLRSGTILKKSDVSRLQSKGVVGDIALRFFDRDGLPVEDELNDRILGITIKQLREIKRVVGVAGGPAKF